MATDETRALVDEIESQRETIRSLHTAIDDLTRAGLEMERAKNEEIAVLRADLARARRNSAHFEQLFENVEKARAWFSRELDAARAAVGEGWLSGGATLAEAIKRKCRALEDDAEHWRRAAEARSLRVEDGDHALHRFAAIAAAKNEGRSAITLTVWSDGTVDAEQYATLDGELDEWGTLHQERRASWGSRPIGEIDALVADLESDDWHTVEHRAPQDFWREIQALRARVAELERDAEEARTKALDEAIEWCRLTEAGDTNEDWQAAARCVRELVEKAKRGTGQDDDALRAEEGGE